MEQAKRVAKNTGILYVQMGITVFMSLYATRLILAALGADDFGIFNLVGGAIAMLTFLNAAMTTASQRFMSFAQGEMNLTKQKSIFNISVVLHFLIGLVVVIILEVAAYFLFGGIFNIAPDRLEVAKLIFQFLIASTFFSIISVPYDAVINAHENLLFVAILRIAEVVLKLAIAIYITYTSYDKLLSFGFLMAVLPILLLFVRQYYCHKKYEEAVINFKEYYSKPLFKEMTGFAGWSFLGTSSSMIANYGQGIVVNMFFGTVVNAAQGVAGQIGGQLSTFAGTMLKALNPMIAKSEGAGDRKLMIKASLIGSKVSFYLLMIFYIPVLLEMPFIFSIWLKNVPDYAVIFCRLLLIRMLIEQLFLTLSSSIIAVGNIKAYQIFNTILNIIPLIVSYILFSLNFPPYVIYIVFIIYSILVAVITLFFSKITFELSIFLFLRTVILPCIASFLITFSISSIPVLVMSESIFRIFLTLTISTAVFMITVWTIGFSQSERNNFLQILKNKKSV